MLQAIIRPSECHFGKHTAYVEMCPALGHEGLCVRFRVETPSHTLIHFFNVLVRCCELSVFVVGLHVSTDNLAIIRPVDI